MKLAKQTTGRPNTIVFQGSFHGRTHQTMAMTTSKTSYRAGHAPLPVGRVRRAVPRSTTRTASGASNRCGSCSSRRPRRARPPRSSSSPSSARAATSPRRCAFLRGLEAICREHGILFVADEVQTGFGRTGPDVRGRALRRAARRAGDGEGPRLGLPDLGDRRVRRADGALAEGQPRRHLRRQPDRLRRRARDHRRAHRARLPRQRERARRAAAVGPRRAGPPRSAASSTCGAGAS